MTYKSPNRRTPKPRPSGVFDISARLQENFQRVEAILTGMQSAEDPHIQLAAAAELRQHIIIAERTLETAGSAEAVQRFQNIVIEAVGRISQKARREIINALNQRTQTNA